MEERYAGALLGLACGDALGTTLEFSSPGSFEPLAEMQGGGPFGLPAGYWTDDTSMAMCLAESLIGCGGFDAADQMSRYVRWWRDGYWSSTGRCFDIGGATSAALRRFEKTGEPASGSADPLTAGNGSLMRLAPVALFYRQDPAAAIRMAAESSRTTHAARTCVDSCRYMAALLVGVLGGAAKEELLSPMFKPVPGLWAGDPLCEEVGKVARGSFRTKRPPEIKGSGYVVESLEAALWAFHSHAGFRAGALAAVNLGDDADTTGAIYGQLAGAFYGEAAIPSKWANCIHRAEEIRQVALRLYSASEEAGRAGR